ncbi:unnamed protein product, partial [Amoebophrya sp. A120]
NNFGCSTSSASSLSQSNKPVNKPPQLNINLINQQENSTSSTNDTTRSSSSFMEQHTTTSSGGLTFPGSNLTTPSNQPHGAGNNFCNAAGSTSSGTPSGSGQGINTSNSSSLFVSSLNSLNNSVVPRTKQILDLLLNIGGGSTTSGGISNGAPERPSGSIPVHGAATGSTPSTIPGGMMGGGQQQNLDPLLVEHQNAASGATSSGNNHSVPALTQLSQVNQQNINLQMMHMLNHSGGGAPCCNHANLPNGSTGGVLGQHSQQNLQPQMLNQAGASINFLATTSASVVENAPLEGIMTQQSAAPQAQQAAVVQQQQHQQQQQQVPHQQPTPSQFVQFQQPPQFITTQNLQPPMANTSATVGTFGSFESLEQIWSQLNAANLVPQNNGDGGAGMTSAQQQQQQQQQQGLQMNLNQNSSNLSQHHPT